TTSGAAGETAAVPPGRGWLLRVRSGTGVFWSLVQDEQVRAGGASQASRIIRFAAVKLYTRTGDTGETSLFGKTRVSKAAPLVDAYGDIDELNAWLGFIRSSGLDDDLDEDLTTIQRDLFAVGAQLADPTDRISGRVTKAFVGDADVERLEGLIDRLETE